MTNITIYSLDDFEYFKQEINYHGSFIEAPLPLSALKINMIENIIPTDLNDCLSTIFFENPDAIFSQITYSKTKKTLSIISNKSLSTEKWNTIRNIKIDKIKILKDIKYLLSNQYNNPNNLLTSYEAFEIIKKKNNSTTLDLNSILQELEKLIRTRFSKAKIILLDYDEKYKDIFISAKIGKKEFDFNIWPFEDELTIEDYTENDTSKFVYECIDNLSQQILDFYNQNPNKQFEYKIRIPNTSLILWINNESISITNDYHNKYERHLILYVGDYIKYSPIKEIYDIINSQEINILKNIFISKKDEFALKLERKQKNEQ